VVRVPVPSVRTPPAPAPEVVQPKAVPATATASEGLALLWAKPGGSLRLRRIKAYKPLIDALEDRPVDPELDDAGPDEDPMSVEDRREIFEVIAAGKTTDGTGMRKGLGDAIRPDGKFVAPLVLLQATMRTPFEARARLEVTLTTVKPFIAPPKEQITGGTAEEPETELVYTPLTEAVGDAKTFLEDADPLCPASLLDGFTKRIVTAFEDEDRDLPAGYLGEETERALLQKRRYQTRLVFGEAHLRTLVDVTGSEEPVPAYLPESLANELPLDTSFRVKFLAELHHRIDRDEASPLALRVVALARVLTRLA
jgi:hypothetical protein